jgi:hypothetical protein
MIEKNRRKKKEKQRGSALSPPPLKGNQIPQIHLLIKRQSTVIWCWRLRRIRLAIVFVTRWTEDRLCNVERNNGHKKP